VTLLPRYQIVIFMLLFGLANGCLGTEYAGTVTCAGCHQAQFEQWQGSHHDWAMTVASDETVLGNFNNASFSHQGVTSTFKRKDGGYYVNTQAANGEYQDFRIDYTFGVEPLQQYLIRFSGGRLQALTIAWDSRPKEQSGQRWYQLMPDDLGEPGEALHWTGAYYNWNSRCAECHSTGLEKNYSMTTNTYATAFAEINVACESCHGPGSNHGSWAKAPTKSQNNGLEIQYSDPLSWRIAEGARIAVPSVDPHKGPPPRLNPVQDATLGALKCLGILSIIIPEPVPFLIIISYSCWRRGSTMPTGKFKMRSMFMGHFCKAKCTSVGLSVAIATIPTALS
jgi:hypothetical protein